jgi:hypothetical protein
MMITPSSTPLAPDLPGLGEADAELLDRLRLGRRQQKDRDLRALGCLDLRQRGFQLRLLLRTERAGQVGHPRLERG